MSTGFVGKEGELDRAETKMGGECDNLVTKETVQIGSDFRES
jgi:hypothetical protein